MFIDLSKTIEETKDFIAITNKSSEKDSIKYEFNISDDEKNLIIKNVGFYIAPQTHSESFGITILEAINAGNIAISSNDFSQILRNISDAVKTFKVPIR